MRAVVPHDGLHHEGHVLARFPRQTETSRPRPPMRGRGLFGLATPIWTIPGGTAPAAARTGMPATACPSRRLPGTLRVVPGPLCAKGTSPLGTPGCRRRAVNGGPITRLQLAIAPPCHAPTALAPAPFDGSHGSPSLHLRSPVPLHSCYSPHVSRDMQDVYLCVRGDLQPPRTHRYLALRGRPPGLRDACCVPVPGDEKRGQGPSSRCAD